MKNYLFKTLWLVCLLLLLPQVSLAGGEVTTCPNGTSPEGSKCPYVKLNLGIPGVSGDNNYLLDVNGDGQGDLEDYILNIFKFSVGLAAVLALVMVMVAGLMWIMAAGQEGLIGKAKLLLTNSLVGLFLALTSVSILQFINPRLVNINLPDITTIQKRSRTRYPSICKLDTMIFVDRKQDTYTNYLKNLYHKPKEEETVKKCGQFLTQVGGGGCFSSYCEDDNKPFCIKYNVNKYKCVGRKYFSPDNDFTSQREQLSFLCLNNCSRYSEQTWGDYHCKSVDVPKSENYLGESQCQFLFGKEEDLHLLNDEDPITMPKIKFK